jgi:UDP-glucose 4-epimerase
VSDERTLEHSPAPGSSPLAAPAPRRRVVAVTGAASFIGTNLIGVLEEDPGVQKLLALDTRPPATAGAKTRVYELNLTSATAEERLAEAFAAEAVDTVVHLAFLPSPTHASGYSHELESVGTMHVLNACRRTRVKKLVMWSQTLLYGAHPTNPNFLSEKHPLRARRTEPFLADKIEAEAEALRFGKPGQGRTVTILRTAPIVGPTVDNFITRFLSHRLVPTVLGFDPLWQFLHEADAIAAFRLAVTRDAPGVFNVTPDGVLPLGTAIRLAGRQALPLPRPFAGSLAGALWIAQVAEAPPSFFDYLQYVCVADGSLAEKVLGFRPLYTSREALIDFANAQHLREVKLLSETPA